jgi:hypothetical protein
MVTSELKYQSLKRDYRSMAIKLLSRGLLREGVCFQWGVCGGRYVVTKVEGQSFECRPIL